jgi:hypothetical protein
VRRVALALGCELGEGALGRKYAGGFIWLPDVQVESGPVGKMKLGFFNFV